MSENLPPSARAYLQRVMESKNAFEQARFEPSKLKPMVSSAEHVAFAKRIWNECEDPQYAQAIIDTIRVIDRGGK